MGVASGFRQRLGQLLLQARAKEMLQPFGRFVQVIQGQRKVLAEVRLPQAMPSHQHLGELPAAVGERQPGRTMVGDFATPSDFRLQAAGCRLKVRGEHCWKRREGRGQRQEEKHCWAGRLQAASFRLQARGEHCWANQQWQATDRPEDGECCAIRVGRREPLDLLRAGRASA